MARKGFRLRILQPDQEVEPRPLDGLPPDADIKTAVFEHPGLAQLAAWLVRRPRLAFRLLSLYSHALLRRPKFAAEAARRDSVLDPVRRG